MRTSPLSISLVMLAAVFSTAEGATAAVPQSRAKAPIYLSVAGEGRVTGGGLSCPPECVASVDVKSRVTLRASPAAGWRFDEWTGPCEGQPATCTMVASGWDLVEAKFTRATASSDGGANSGSSGAKGPASDSDEPAVRPPAPAPVRWLTKKKGRVATATAIFAAGNGIDYSIAAVGAKRVAGSCAITAGQARCVVRLRRGVWTIVVLPTRNGVQGTATTKSVRVV